VTDEKMELFFKVILQCDAIPRKIGFLQKRFDLLEKHHIIAAS
jgi:hypothetical protein